MPDLPEHPSLEHLHKQAKARKRDRAIRSGAPTRHSTPTGDDRVDALLANYAALK